MPGNVSDEAFAREAQQAGVVTYDELAAARAKQAEEEKRGILVPLADMLVQQGLIRPNIRENIEKKLQARQAGVLMQLGSYKLMKKIGEGGMGAVYLAEDTMAGRKVAVKILPKEYSDNAEALLRFRREAQATGKLNHVNIVIAYNVAEEAGTHYYAMEYCEGETLDKILDREEHLPCDKAFPVVIQVACGLKHAHDHGIIHRDIKPANIFICKPLAPGGSGQGEGDALPAGFVAKILDLGLSKNLASTGQSYLTQTGRAMGTPHYISPEQARGVKEIDGRTDIYSLGATLYHMLTGRAPFGGSNPAIVIAKHICEELPNPQDIRGDIPDNVVHIIEKMMAKDVADRYRDCQELLDDLELVSRGKVPSSKALAAGRSTVGVRGRVALPPERRPQAKAALRPAAAQRPEPAERRKIAPDDGAAPPGRAQTGWSSKAIGVAAAVLAVVAVVVAVVLVSNSNRHARAEQEAREKSKKEEALQQAEKAKRQAEEERERAAKAEKEKRMLEDQLREARLATEAAKKKAEAIGEKAEQKPATPTVPATTVQAEQKPAPPAAPTPATKPEPAAVPAEKGSGTDVAVAYETALEEAYGLLGKLKVQQAEKRLDQAKADPKLEALRQALELDKKCAHLVEDWNKAVAAGAALLSKDARAFTLRYADGKPPYEVGKGSKNRVKGVSGEIIETEMDLGGGFAGKKVPLDTLAPQTRCELAELALPPEAQTDLKLGFAGLLALQSKAEGFTAEAVRKRLEAAHKKGAPADIVTHIRERLEVCEREQHALAALKQIDDTLKAGELQDARTLLEKAKQDHAGTLALARAQAGIEDRLAELARPMYLADLPELEVKTYGGMFDFGKGRYKEGPELKLNGTLYPKGLAMHPPHDGSGHVAYMLDKRYRYFQATAAICDSGGVGPDGRTGKPLIFRVAGDGKELWKSQPMQRKSQSEECKVDVSGVSKLELFIDCLGGNADGGHAAWLDALVRGGATGAAAPRKNP
ncbi:MAG: protein kinase [Planctomycetota bacterium]